MRIGSGPATAVVLASRPERVLPATEYAVPATERVLPATERVLPATERVLPATERVLPATERVLSAADPETRRWPLLWPRSPKPPNRLFTSSG